MNLELVPSFAEICNIMLVFGCSDKIFIFQMFAVNNRRSETESYGEVGAEPDQAAATDQPANPPKTGSTRKAAKKTATSSSAARDKNLLLSSDDEFQ